MTKSFSPIELDVLANVTGGDGGPVSPETVGCAIGGAAAAETGPWGVAAGCIAGGALANGVADAVKHPSPINPAYRLGK